VADEFVVYEEYQVIVASHLGGRNDSAQTAIKQDRHICGPIWHLAVASSVVDWF